MTDKLIPKNSGKAPSFQFYYKDWLGDQRLKRAGPEIKGAWIDIICWSMDMPVPGLFVDGKDKKTPLKIEEIANFLDGNFKKNLSLLKQIISRNILKKDEKTGAFMVHRIYKDTQLRRIRAECGKKGGNPQLKKGYPNPYYQKDNHHDNQIDNQIDKQKDNQKITPSARKKKMKKYSSSLVLSSSLEKDNQKYEPPDKGSPEEWEAFREKARLKEQQARDAKNKY